MLFRSRLAIALGFTVAGSALACSLYAVSAWWVQPVTGTIIAPAGAAAWFAAVLPVLAIAVLAVLHALQPVLGSGAAGRALRIHAVSGFYVGIRVGRVLDRVASVFDRPVKGITHA